MIIGLARVPHWHDIDADHRTFLGAYKCRRERMSRLRKVLSCSAYMENIPRVQPERRPLFSLATPRRLGKRTAKLN
jgi:hypothetical protein